MSENHDAADDATAHWEARYGESEQIWSGNPNDALVDTVGELTPNRALDLGCGEGADSVWLAERGWRVRAVDISATAVGRGRAQAASRGLPDGAITWVVTNLDRWRPEGDFDLVSACFLHSHATLDRVGVLRRAAAAVAPDGYLLVVGHAHPPPWAAEHEHAEDMFQGPEGELEQLALDPDGWEVLVSEIRPRAVHRDDVGDVDVEDSVLFLRRRA